MLRILVTGSRQIIDTPAAVAKTLNGTARAMAARGYDTSEITLVHGGARGLDRRAGTVARAQGWSEEVHHADWKTHGRAAGPLRNKAMVEAGADVVVGFPAHANPADGSRGTWNCLGYAVDADLLTVIRDIDCLDDNGDIDKLTMTVLNETVSNKTVSNKTVPDKTR